MRSGKPNKNRKQKRYKFIPFLMKKGIVLNF